MKGIFHMPRTVGGKGTDSTSVHLLMRDISKGGLSLYVSCSQLKYLQNQLGECAALRYVTINIGSWFYWSGPESPFMGIQIQFCRENRRAQYLRYHVNWQSKPCLHGLITPAQGCMLTTFSFIVYHQSLSSCH